jgi:AbrB family transcriptional regulator (stage V sporulation protein T)
MERFAAKVEKSGRILIPAPVRRQLGLKEGESEVLVEVDQTGLKVSTRRQIIERSREMLRKYIPEGTDLTAELIEDRRREAQREDSK